MKTAYHIIGSILLLFFLIGCESITDIETEEFSKNQISFTSFGLRSGGIDQYGDPASDRNILEVPDTVGVFVIKTDGTPEFIMENTFYRITTYKSDNFLSTGVDKFPIIDFRPGGTPVSGEEQLLWYKTAHAAAYWDEDISVEYDFFAYAPAVKTNEPNNYYTIDNDGIINFRIDEKAGIPVDFIYAKKEDCTNVKADSLHLFFKHKLSKMVFKLKNDTENAITCYGVKYKIKYPTATFDLINDKWSFFGNTTEVEVKRYAQYEIFSKTEVPLPELTTLLFPTHTTNYSGIQPGNVVAEFHVCLNNIWYDMTEALDNPSIQYTEGKLIELTFNCKLKYGDEVRDENGDLWNIFVATFDSFEDGDPITGILK